MIDPGLFLTGDGSHSIRSEKFQVPYHSIHGAIQETEHVFIQAGLVKRLETKKKLKVLETGLGTGLNAFMAYLFADGSGQERQKINIHYTSLEAYPVGQEVYQQLNFATQLNSNKQEQLQRMHTAEWGKDIMISENFTFKKLLIDFNEYAFPNEFDLIFFDAFAPTSQPEFWEPPFLAKVYNCLLDDGILTTYCAKGSFKRALKEVGFSIESIPGPPRKREMVRATKKVA